MLKKILDFFIKNEMTIEEVEEEIKKQMEIIKVETNINYENYENYEIEIINAQSCSKAIGYLSTLYVKGDDENAKFINGKLKKAIDEIEEIKSKSVVINRILNNESENKNNDNRKNTENENKENDKKKNKRNDFEIRYKQKKELNNNLIKIKEEIKEKTNKKLIEMIKEINKKEKITKKDIIELNLILEDIKNSNIEKKEFESETLKEMKKDILIASAAEVYSLKYNNLYENDKDTEYEKIKGNINKEIINDMQKSFKEIIMNILERTEYSVNVKSAISIIDVENEAKLQENEVINTNFLKSTNKPKFI